MAAIAYAAACAASCSGVLGGACACSMADSAVRRIASSPPSRSRGVVAPPPAAAAGERLGSKVWDFFLNSATRASSLSRASSNAARSASAFANSSASSLALARASASSASCCARRSCSSSSACSICRRRFSIQLSPSFRLSTFGSRSLRRSSSSSFCLCFSASAASAAFLRFSAHWLTGTRGFSLDRSLDTDLSSPPPCIFSSSCFRARRPASAAALRSGSAALWEGDAERDRGVAGVPSPATAKSSANPSQSFI
mmetsp:Transcript_7761/g.14637  ORF Transcript_7761/g.14637 Transcript_7761/m.14637 type:complete len:255 (-) Transcript_7761:650-1414(-)